MAIVSIIRLRVLVTQDLSNPDVTYYMTDVLMWTNVEINVGLLCACLPSLRPIITFLRTGSLFSAATPSEGSCIPGTPGMQSKNRGPKRLFTVPRSTTCRTNSDDEKSIVKTTTEDRKMVRGVGISQDAWGKSHTDVEVSMDDLGGRKNSDRYGRINVTTDWSVQFDRFRSSESRS